MYTAFDCDLHNRGIDSNGKFGQYLVVSGDLGYGSCTDECNAEGDDYGDEVGVHCESTCRECVLQAMFQSGVTTRAYLKIEYL
jgi:hypothetical protein